MIIYVTGVPGSAKTLRTMFWLNEAGWYNRLDSNGKPLLDGDGNEILRPVYSNINGEDGEALPAGHRPLPDDWRDVPDGSVVVVDEAQHRWPQRGPSKPVPDEISALDTHRHRGIDFILTTQRPTGVDHHVRGLVGKHEHLRRKAGAQISMITVKGEAFDPNDRDAVASADQFPWPFPKKLYGTYKSSVEHTGAYRFKMPKKIAFMLGGVGLMFAIPIGFIIYKSTIGGGFLPSGQADSQEKQEPAPTADEARRVLSNAGRKQTPTYANVRTFEEVEWCIQTPDSCRCGNRNGLLGMDEVDCITAARSIKFRGKSGSTYVDPSRLAAGQNQPTERASGRAQAQRADRAGANLLNSKNSG